MRSFCHCMLFLFKCGQVISQIFVYWGPLLSTQIDESFWSKYILYGVLNNVKAENISHQGWAQHHSLDAEPKQVQVVSQCIDALQPTSPFEHIISCFSQNFLLGTQFVTAEKVKKKVCSSRSSQSNISYGTNLIIEET